MNKTHLALLLAYGASEIPLKTVCVDFFGVDEPEARRRASLGLLPVKAYRCGSQKSPWLVSAYDLADLIEKRRARAKFSPDAA